MISDKKTVTAYSSRKEGIFIPVLFILFVIMIYNFIFTLKNMYQN